MPCQKASPASLISFYLQNTAAKKTLLLGRVKIATHNLFQLINRHLKQHGPVPIENTPLQLDKVSAEFN